MTEATDTQAARDTAAELGKREVMAVGPYAWGRGATEKEAIAECRKNLSSGKTHEVHIFDVPEGTAVNGMGAFVYWPPEGRRWPGEVEEGAEGADLEPMTKDEVAAWKPFEIAVTKVRKR